MKNGQTYLVTGATSGIGLATAAQLARAGNVVIAVGGRRTPVQAAEAALRRVAPQAHLEMLAVDLSDLADVRRLASEVTARHERLDALINNAGRASGGQPTRDGYDLVLATNVLGPFLLTNLLVDLLRASAPARIVTVTSSVHRGVKSLPWADLERGRFPAGMDAYRATKLMNLLFTRELATRLNGSGVVALAADPGFVRTNLGRDATGLFGLFLKLVRPFQTDPDVAAVNSVRLASQSSAADLNGSYVLNGKPIAPSAMAQDDGAAARLWRLSASLTGLAPAS